jgi:hypothetical protein
MRRIFAVLVLGLLGAAGPARAGAPFHPCCGNYCKETPPPDCPDCSCACDHRLCCTLFHAEHAQGLIETVQIGDSCQRHKAVKKLGCRLHADYCRDPAVLDTLIGALQCDPCWEVRRAAAWSLMGQDARTDAGLLALYIASKLDPNYQVRTRAAEALDIVTRCRVRCYKQLFASADVLIGQLRALNYKPGQPGL